MATPASLSDHLLKMTHLGTVMSGQNYIDELSREKVFQRLSIRLSFLKNRS